MTQNTSHAVMAQRHEAHDSLDFFPTPPWATRALCEWLKSRESLGEMHAWDPACGQHDMVRPLREYFMTCAATDISAYPDVAHEVEDFLWPSDAHVGWIITNPPFRLAEQFATTAIARADRGVALLVRTAFLESADRHTKLFTPKPPSDILQFVERVPMQKGIINRLGSTATAYCWIVWRVNASHLGTQFHWLAPCRKRLERDSDYEGSSP